MGQEFVIKSTALEDKINQLLPSQGGAQAGVDLSASTMIVPAVNLTESAEGSNLRQDLQRALSLDSISAFNVNNTTTTLVSTTGYFKIFGNSKIIDTSAVTFKLTDGTTTKTIIEFKLSTGANTFSTFEFDVFIPAGDSLQVVVGASSVCVGCTRQIADINGNLVNPI